MSVSSFPRPEHVAALLEKIQERVRHYGQSIEVVEAGLNQYRCEYKFELRQSGNADAILLSIHFQFAERCLNSGNDAEISRLIDRFLEERF